MNEELRNIRPEVPGEIQILRVLRRALGVVPGKHAEERPYVRDEAEVIEDHDAGDAREQREHDAADEQRKRKLVAAVPPGHEVAKAVFNFLPH